MARTRQSERQHLPAALHEIGEGFAHRLHLDAHLSQIVHDGAKLEDKMLLPIGEGIIDHRLALELLMTVNYDGYISGDEAAHAFSLRELRIRVRPDTSPEKPRE